MAQESSSSFPRKWKIAQRPLNVDVPTNAASSSSNAQEFQPVKILRGTPRREGSPQQSIKVLNHAIQPSPQILQKQIVLQENVNVLCQVPKKTMSDAVKLLDDNWDFTDFCKEYLLDSNKKFTVIGAVGATGSGKSTVLSMLAGNDPADLYREYVFRPSAREAVESSRFQTTKIYVYINKNRTIFLDCQAIGCASLFEEYIYKRQNLPVSADAFEYISLQLLTFLISVCHTLLFCIDWFIDLASVRELLKVEASLLADRQSSRQINLVVLHQRSKESDFQQLLVYERMNILEGIFENSIFNICGGLNMASLGFKRYSPLKSNVNYVLLGDLKPRARNTMDARAAETAHITEFRPYDKKYHMQTSCPTIEYVDVIEKLRTKVLELQKTPLYQCIDSINEADWYNLAFKTWKRLSAQLYSGHESYASAQSMHWKENSSSKFGRNTYKSNKEISRPQFIPRNTLAQKNTERTKPGMISIAKRTIPILAQSTAPQNYPVFSSKVSNVDELGQLRGLSLTDDSS